MSPSFSLKTTLLTMALFMTVVIQAITVVPVKAQSTTTDKCSTQQAIVTSDKILMYVSWKEGTQIPSIQIASNVVSGNNRQVIYVEDANNPTDDFVTVQNLNLSDGWYTATIVVDQAGLFNSDSAGILQGKNIQRSGLNNYFYYAIDTDDGDKECQGSGQLPQSASGPTDGSGECEKSTEQNILSQWNQSMSGIKYIHITYKSCMPNTTLSMGFLDANGGQQPGSYVSTTCNSNGICDAYVPVPDDNQETLTLRINRTGSDGDLLRVSRARTVTPTGCNVFNSTVPNTISPGQDLSLVFTRCDPTHKYVAWLSANDGSGSISDDPSACDWAPEPSQCSFTFSVSKTQHSSASDGTIPATIRVVDQTDPQNPVTILSAPITVQTTAGVDPCAGMDEKSDEGRKCRAKDLCAINNNVGIDSAEAEECANIRYCNSKKSEGYVYLLAFNKACNNLPEFVTTLLNYIMIFATLIAGGMFARGMFGILTSRGNPASIAEARDTLMQAVIGLVLLASAFVIIQFLGGAFNSIPGWNIDLTPFIKPA